MHPELLRIPLAGGLSIKSYGTFMVIGFLAAVWVLRRLAKREGLDPNLINSVALYALIAGIAGARLFYVIHYWQDFRDDWLEVFRIWRGGLEFLGGVLLALLVLLICVRRWRLPAARLLDICAIGLMVGLVFGRIGCFLNGCCFGRPTDLPWGVRFPYNSFAYISQINPNPKRNRPHPQLELPRDYLDYVDQDGRWHPRPLEQLTSQQRYEVTEGHYRSLPVHPTQIYESIAAFCIAGLLYLFWSHARSDQQGRRLYKAGMTFPLMFFSYGLVRFMLEFVRDDNPYEWGRFTISQWLGLGLAAVGCCIWVISYLSGRSRSAR
ncbi:MAG: prolipoprotein diacylglyceryl transferase [Sedimentisphaerales bacterium]|jgi:phosphatidylglycerol:prolipoprotein diacylglycerol transferase|nr:prolipoprotein diacylglyceryl transferase [Sedimentisphaerales bacterium]